MGAIATGNVRVVNRDVVDALGISPEVLDEVAAAETLELEPREASYREGQAAPTVAGRTVVLVDDGLATGSTMRAAIQAVRTMAPARIVRPAAIFPVIPPALATTRAARRSRP